MIAVAGSMDRACSDHGWYDVGAGNNFTWYKHNTNSIVIYDDLRFGVWLDKEPAGDEEIPPDLSGCGLEALEIVLHYFDMVSAIRLRHTDADCVAIAIKRLPKKKFSTEREWLDPFLQVLDRLRVDQELRVEVVMKKK